LFKRIPINQLRKSVLIHLLTFGGKEADSLKTNQFFNDVINGKLISKPEPEPVKIKGRMVLN